MPGGLLTDLYELNMAASYLRRDMNHPATFSLYVRGLPKARGFLVAAGLEACIEFLESFCFTDAELEVLGSMGFDDRALADFSTLRFEGEVWAVPEGRIVHSEEPLLELTAPVAVAQVIETVLLNQITLHTTLASKAASRHPRRRSNPAKRARTASSAAPPREAHPRPARPSSAPAM